MAGEESAFLASVVEGSGTVCDKALELVDDAREQFKRFSAAFFVVVAAAAIALVIAIAFIDVAADYGERKGSPTRLGAPLAWNRASSRQPG